MNKMLKGMIKAGMVELGARYGQHRKKDTTPRLWIMMYHRVLPETDSEYAIEEPGMMVTPETLDMHFSVLKQEFTLISLREWLERVQADRPLPEKACAITFDDGWLDNYQYAYPIIQQHQVPITLYAVSDMIGTHQTFWPNRLAKILTSSNQQLQQLDWLRPLLRDLDGQQATSNEYTASVIYQMKSFQDDQLLNWLDEAENTLGISEPESPVLMHWSQLSEMSQNELIDIGAHTCRHLRLSAQLPLAVAESEIVKSKQQLEQQLEQPVELFCYPNGDFTDKVTEIVSQHYQSAVTTHRGINRLSSLSPYRLDRIGLHNDISNTPKKLLARIGMGF